MADWRASILEEFVAQVAGLTLVADPDGLLLEEDVLASIRERGFEILEYDDPIEFRFALAGKQANIDGVKKTSEIVVAYRGPAEDLDMLPYDLLETGRRLHFSLGELFPNLSYPVLARLDRSDLDVLYHAQRQYKTGHLGDNATKEFVLRHVFKIAPELIKKPSDLLCALLRRHHGGRHTPVQLDDRFIEILKQQGIFQEWPLEAIVLDREAFLQFLQERWPIFLEKAAAQAGKMVKEDRPEHRCKIAGPKDLPFDHDDVRVYVDNLFLEGLLEAVEFSDGASVLQSWVRIGVRQDPVSDRQTRFVGLAAKLSDAVPGEQARHADWMQFSQRWSELTALRVSLGAKLSAGQVEAYSNIQCAIDKAFDLWLMGRYAGLHNQPANPPVMLHHVPRAIARYISDTKSNKAALLVVDGLSLDQWVPLRDSVTLQKPHLTIREHAVFAWIPTITSVSRQTVFSGKAPLFFPSSIHTTNKEPALWTQFWADHGLTQRNVGYAKTLGDGDLSRVDDLAGNPATRVVGLVVDTVDKIMHGMELGDAGMHTLVRQWAEEGFMTKLIDLLLSRGFRIYLTSDHGNIEATGCGRPAEGSVADLRGERVRVYPDDVLRTNVHAQYPNAVEWPTWGLPNDYLPLLAGGRSAFVKPGDRVVCHGGASIEEMLVPFVEIESGAK